VSHPHPHANGPIGHVPHPPTEPLGEPSATNRRLWVVAAVLAVIAILAIVLTWQSVRSKDQARTAAAAVSKACEQVQGLGQKCATAGPEGSPGVAAIIPEPSVAGSLRPSIGTSRSSSPGPDETAAQPGMPGGPMVNPGSDLIIGLTLRDHRLEITYADGTIVDAGRVDGSPPAIVLPVGSPAPAPAPPVASSEPPPTPDITPEDIVPSDERPVPDIPAEESYVP
jgi:hypothetical protein